MKYTSQHCCCDKTMDDGMVNKDTLVGFRGSDRPSHPPLGSAPGSAWALLLRSDETGAFKDRKGFSFQIGLCSDPHLWSWILGDDLKDTDKRTDGRGGIFAKSPQCDTSWQGAQIWNQWSPECQATSPNTNCVSSAIYPECPRKEWRVKSFGL